MALSNDKKAALGVGGFLLLVGAWFSLPLKDDAPETLVSVDPVVEPQVALAPVDEDTPAPMDVPEIQVQAEQNSTPIDEVQIEEVPVDEVALADPVIQDATVQAPDTAMADVVVETIAPASDIADPAQSVETPDEPAEVDAARATQSQAPEIETTEADQADQADAVQQPSFDLVRVETDGSAVVAGQAEPGSNVEITSDGVVIGTARASATGDFVALVDTPRTGAAQNIGLSSQSGDNESVTSDQSVIVIVEAPVDTDATDQEPVALAAPVVILSTPDGIELMQSAEAVTGIVIDSITYSESGDVVLTGRGEPGSAALIYANDAPIMQADIRQDGNWIAILNEINVGVYTLRVDEVTQGGEVLSRAETPFQREEPAIVEAAQDNNLSVMQLTVQPGTNLWTIAREVYGEGTLYTQIFTANADQIRDPNLIYPGQIFSLPNNSSQ